MRIWEITTEFVVFISLRWGLLCLADFEYKERVVKEGGGGGGA